MEFKANRKMDLRRKCVEVKMTIVECHPRDSE